MTSNGRWKTILAYTAGIIILAVSVILAWFLPGWYGEWQDERLMGQVTLSSREYIEFLDSDSLDIAGRMQMLSEAQEFIWSDYGYGYYTVDGYGEEYYNGHALSGHFEEIVSRCRSAIDQWWECGLLPIDCRGWVNAKNTVLISEKSVFVDNTLLPVYFMAFTEDIEAVDSPSLMTVIMDGEKELIYYAAFTSSEVRDAMARELGYDSQLHMVEGIVRDYTKAEKEIDTSKFDFAAVCGAEEAEITSAPGQLELSVKLKFDNFDGYASRNVIQNEGGFGVSIALGTRRWLDIIPEMYVGYGTYEDLLSTELWQDMLWSEGTGIPIDKVEEYTGIESYAVAAETKEDYLVP